MFVFRLLKPRSWGQALAEFALIMPVLFLLIFALLDLGRAVYVYNTLANAARQGARVAAVNQNASGGGNCDPLDRTQWSIVACVLQAGVSIPVQRTDIDIQYHDTGTGTSCADRELDPPCVVSVTVSQEYVPLTPLIGDILGPIHLESTSEMPVESWFP